MSELGGTMSESLELKIDEITFYKKEEVVEDVANNERNNITKVLEQEDMLWKNVRRIKGC